jgi:hypothetical protein
MKRILIISAIAAASAAVSVPAFAGLANNPSFSHRLPVNVPSQAKVVHLDDHGNVVEKRHGADDPASTRVTSPSHKSSKGAPEPGDDRGGATNGRSTEPGDDRGATTEPGDDRGRGTEPGDDRGATTEPGDDRGHSSEPGDDSGHGSEPGDDSGHSSEPGDDRGGHGGHGGA